MEEPLFRFVHVSDTLHEVIKPNSLYPVVSIAKARHRLDWKPSYTFADYLHEVESSLKEHTAWRGCRNSG